MIGCARVRFEFYSVEEFTTVLRHRIRCLGWDIEDCLLALIAARSRGTPRLALRLLQAAYRVCRSEGETSITAVHLNRACSLEQIDALGLGPVEQQYVSILKDGPIRLNVIASLVGLPSRTVAEVTEPFLIRAGLLTKDDQGRRQLTAAGYDHASKLCPTSV